MTDKRKDRKTGRQADETDRKKIERQTNIQIDIPTEKVRERNEKMKTETENGTDFCTKCLLWRIKEE